MAVANSTSQGTSRAKKLDGVTSSSTAPSAPPTRLMTIRARERKAGGAADMLRDGEAGDDLAGKQRHGGGDIGGARIHAGQDQGRQGEEGAAARQRVLHPRPQRGRKQDCQAHKAEQQSGSAASVRDA